jgi:hypothetical protein
MNTPDTEERFQIIESILQTHSTLLTSFHGRLAELNTYAPKAQPRKPLQLFLVMRTDFIDLQEVAGVGYYKEFVVCCEDAETARLTSPYWWGSIRYLADTPNGALIDSRGGRPDCRWAKNVRDIGVRHLGEAAAEISQGIVSISYVPWQ